MDYRRQVIMCSDIYQHEPIWLHIRFTLHLYNHFLIPQNNSKYPPLRFKHLKFDIDKILWNPNLLSSNFCVEIRLCLLDTQLHLDNLRIYQQRLRMYIQAYHTHNMHHWE